jgi:integrase/recombinase XerD
LVVTNTTTTSLHDEDGHVLLERKVDIVTSGLPSEYCKLLYRIAENDALTICYYIASMKTEVNLSDNYRASLVKVLSKFSTFCSNKGNKQSFKELRREDIVAFLDSFRRTEAIDPLHTWIGTYNLYRIHLMRFFKWLYYPDIEPDKRPKPEVVNNIPRLRRKEQSIYKPSDLWTAEDDLLFLKYCPSKRIKCYHMVSRDLSCRPHEILKLKIKDIFFKSAGNHQYAEVLVNGKTRSRSIPLIDSIPYVKDYLDHEHPQPGNPNAVLISGNGKSFGRIIGIQTIELIYRQYKKKFFPKLLESSNVPIEDKQKIQELLKKPWNPYIRRHSALTEKSTILKEHVLRQHAGWSPRSQMHLKYLHYFGNESSESLLEAYGIVTKDQQLSDVLKPKQCPNCNEPNKPDSKFCVKCRMILTYDAYNETVTMNQKYEQELQQMKEQMSHVSEKFDKMDQLAKKLGITDDDDDDDDADSDDV